MGRKSRGRTNSRGGGCEEPNPGGPYAASMKLLSVAVAHLLVLAMSACSATPAPVVTVTAAPQASATADPNVITPTPSPTPTMTRSERGNAIKKIGDEAVLIDGYGEVAVRFKVTKIQPNFKCTSEFADKSANGQYVGIWMDITTTKAVDMDSDDADVVPYFNPGDWQVIGPDGVTENDSYGNGYSCPRDSDSLPSQLGSNKHVKGVVVVDTKLKSGHLALVQDFLDSGWEWELS